MKPHEVESMISRRIDKYYNQNKKIEYKNSQSCSLENGSVIKLLDHIESSYSMR